MSQGVSLSVGSVQGWLDKVWRGGRNTYLPPGMDIVKGVYMSRQAEQSHVKQNTMIQAG